MSFSTRRAPAGSSLGRSAALAAAALEAVTLYLYIFATLEWQFSMLNQKNLLIQFLKLFSCEDKSYDFHIIYLLQQIVNYCH